MRAIKYLSQIKKLDEQINRKIRTAKRWRDMAYKITVDPTKEHYNPNRNTSAPYEKCIVKADELEREVTADIDRLVDLKYEVEAKICMIDDEMCQDILRLRYVELFLWEDVIAVVGKCRSYVFDRHSKALTMLDEILKEK